MVIYVDGTAVVGGANGKIIILRTGDTSLPLTISYKVKGSAVQGVDYKPLAGTVTILAGSTKAKLKIKPLADPVAGTRKVKLRLLPASDGSYLLGDPSAAKIKVVDDE